MIFVKEAKHQMALKNVLPEQQFVCFPQLYIFGFFLKHPKSYN